MWSSAHVTIASVICLITLGYQVVLGLGICLAETYATYDPFATVRGVAYLPLEVDMWSQLRECIDIEEETVHA